jgi:mannose-1-phosphate guanylyltransferase
MIVVDTGDALLVCSKERAQDVKAVVDRLKREGRGELL